MASPWTSQTTQRRPAERPWMGLALLLAVPLLSLVLIRMLWSDSTLWFLIAGILMLGGAAAAFLARRDTPSYGYPTLSPEPNRLPFVLLGLGALFLAMLILPNFSSGSEPLPAARLQSSAGTPRASNSQAAVQPTAVLRSQPTRARPTPTQETASQEPSSTPSEQASNGNPPAGSEVYVVQEGDTLWDIAQQYNITVDDIVAANNLDNAEDLQLGDELLIPPSSDDEASNTAADTDATPAP